MYEQQYYRESIKKQKKRRLAWQSMLVGIVVGAVSQFVVDIMINLLAKKPLSQIATVTSSWQVYYTSVIAGGINGILVIFIPSSVFPIAAVLIIMAVYNALLIFSTREEMQENSKSNTEFTTGIIRDVFIILLVVYLINQFSSKENDSEEKDFESLLAVTLISSIVLNISFFLSQTGINNILGLTTRLRGGVTFDV